MVLNIRDDEAFLYALFIEDARLLCKKRRVFPNGRRAATHCFILGLVLVAAADINW